MLLASGGCCRLLETKVSLSLPSHATISCYFYGRHRFTGVRFLDFEHCHVANQQFSCIQPVCSDVGDSHQGPPPCSVGPNVVTDADIMEGIIGGPLFSCHLRRRRRRLSRPRLRMNDDRDSFPYIHESYSDYLPSPPNPYFDLIV